MEWVETTAKSVEEAKDLALDKLGVDETEAEFDVVEEPRQGLFGRTRGEARVRARVQPKAPRAKDDRRDRRRRGGKGKGKSDNQRNESKTSETSKAGSKEAVDSGGSSQQASSTPKKNGSQGSNGGKRKQSNQSDRGKSGSGDASKRQGKPRADRQQKKDAPMEDVRGCVEEFLTGLTGAFGIEAPVTINADDEQIVASIEGKHGLLLGPKARTLDAIQELTRVTAQRRAPSSIRIKVDVGGYREARRVALANFATEAASRAIDDGAEVVLEPMNAADRKVVHDALNDVAGVGTRSAGTDPRRYVIVVPTKSAEHDDAASPAQEAENTVD